MVKKLVALSKGEMVMFIGDDTLPQKNFLKNAIKVMKSIHDGYGLVGLNDKNKPGYHPQAHWLAHKKILPEIGGEFFHTGYIHQFCDNELALRAQNLKRYKYAEDAIVKHPHPIYHGKGKTAKDKIKNSKNKDLQRVYNKDVFKHDSELYLKRIKKILPITFTGERVVMGDMKGNSATLQEHIARYNFALLPCMDKTILDAACGSGYGVDLMAEVAYEAYGIDRDKKSIDFAKSKYKGGFSVLDIDKNMLPRRNYDIITSFETIEHLENPEKFLRWVSKHCEMFIFSIPVNNKSMWHANSWNEEQIMKMMHKHFKTIDWFAQVGPFFFKYPGQVKPVFLVGMTSK